MSSRISGFESDGNRGALFCLVQIRGVQKGFDGGDEKKREGNGGLIGENMCLVEGVEERDFNRRKILIYFYIFVNFYVTFNLRLFK